MHSPKIAICVSGIAKYWRHSYNSIQKWFPNADAFIHTWDIELHEITPTTAYSVNEYTEITNKNHTIKDIVDQYKPKTFIIDKFSDTSKLFFKQRDNLIQKGADTDSRISLYSMAYSMRESCRLKKAYECSNNFIYDIVFRMRFDTNIPAWDHSTSYCEEAIVIPVGQDFAEKGINDQFSYGPSALMDQLCEYYHHLDIICTTPHWLRSPEHCFYNYLESVNLIPNRIIRKNIVAYINNAIYI